MADLRLRVFGFGFVWRAGVRGGGAGGGRGGQVGRWKR